MDIKDFFDFIYQRYLIFHKKEILKLSPPYTEDPILSNYKFCNVFREDDAGTKIIFSLPSNNKRELLTNIFSYRIFNRRDHFDNIGWINISNFSPHSFKEHLLSIKEKRPIFSDAYLVNWNLDNILNSLEFLSSSYDLDKLNKDSPKEVFNELKKLKCIGPFLAYQLFQDLSYFGDLFHRFNGNDFVEIGPGCLGALDLLNNSTNVSHLNFIYLIRDDLQYKYLDPLVPRLTLSSIEHSLCEFRKYYNLKYGNGKKRRYRITT